LYGLWYDLGKNIFILIYIINYIIKNKNRKYKQSHHKHNLKIILYKELEFKIHISTNSSHQ